MTLRFFAIPAGDPVAAEAELNHLLAASRVLAVDRHFVANGEASFWVVCVRIASGPGPLPAALKADQAGARDAARRARWMPAPTAPRLAGSVGHAAAR